MPAFHQGSKVRERYRSVREPQADENTVRSMRFVFRRVIISVVIFFVVATPGQAFYPCEVNCREERDRSIKACMVDADFSSPTYDRCINNAYVVYRACLRKCVLTDYFERRKDSP
jgi:hypothetical protein